MFQIALQVSVTTYIFIYGTLFIFGSCGHLFALDTEEFFFGVIKLNSF